MSQPAHQSSTDVCTNVKLEAFGGQFYVENTAGAGGARFALIVHHTDAEREWAYDRTSHAGKLNKALDEAAAKGWTVVSMKDDRKTIFPK